MTLFLTSNPFVEGTAFFSNKNDFTDLFMYKMPNPARALFVASNPADVDGTEQWAQFMKESLGELGANILTLNVLHDKTAHEAPFMVSGANFIVLNGGHVPTQNRFFHRIGLRALLQDWNGVLMGISAGSMNSADIVYALPEEPGETFDPYYQRYLSGLGLTKTCIIPHFQKFHDAYLDGKHVVNDLAKGDSMGHCFYALPDGSFLYRVGQREELHGPAWIIKDGECTLCNHEGEILLLHE